MCLSCIAIATYTPRITLHARSPPSGCSSKSSSFRSVPYFVVVSIEKISREKSFTFFSRLSISTTGVVGTLISKSRPEFSGRNPKKGTEFKSRTSENQTLVPRGIDDVSAFGSFVGIALADLDPQ